MNCPQPAYVHIPLLVDAQGRRLAKRDKDLDLTALAQRFTPADILGMLAFSAGLLEEVRPVTLEELIHILDCNFEGYEDLHKKLLSAPKYGNNDPVADTYAAAMADFFAQKINNVPNEKGGVYKAIFHSARGFIRHGLATGALPDGRRAGEELSKNASPVVGMDKKGVTALISSALKLRPEDYHESFCVDVMLHPSTVAGEEGFTVFKSLLTTYLKGDGQSIQFNIFNADTLRDAQNNPEKYRNLQVRVCGWNTLWNNMSKTEQDSYILRAENVER